MALLSNGSFFRKGLAYHPRPTYEVAIILAPRLTFGTGEHACDVGQARWATIRSGLKAALLSRRFVCETRKYYARGKAGGAHQPQPSLACVDAMATGRAPRRAPRSMSHRGSANFPLMGKFQGSAGPASSFDLGEL
jgi:hypothetical protein